MITEAYKHIPVLTREVIEYLHVEKGAKYVDATVGGGGHAGEILRLGGVVLGIDQDPEAIEIAKRNLKVKSEKLKIVRGNFKDIERIVREHGFVPVDGVLFDLGMSSMQIASPRGFSFEAPAFLDMRMSPEEQGVTAADLVNGLREDQLYALFSQTTQKHLARTVARAIVGARGAGKIERTDELRKLVEGVYRGGRRKISPATTIFLALRIAVNSELENLKEGLMGAKEILRPGGRLVVISFHSGEDRIVKQFFRKGMNLRTFSILTKKPVVPDFNEVRSNPRSRSAKLRAAQKRWVN